MIKKLFSTVTCSPGLRLEFYDVSNRYYGDYHQVLIEIDLLVGGESPLRLRYQRPLRRMAVSSARLETEKKCLVDGFLATTLGYLGSAGFEEKLRVKLQAGEHQVWKPVD
jgi:hypothetical protein